jgi:hypothetical protein
MFAKKAFGTMNSEQSYGDYLTAKKRKNNNIFIKNTFNKSNLGINLITKLDLTDVAVIATNTNPQISPSTITIGETPYLNYVIDPNGSLFGNTPCGLRNFEHYLIPLNYSPTG